MWCAVVCCGVVCCGVVFGQAFTRQQTGGRDQPAASKSPLRSPARTSTSAQPGKHHPASRGWRGAMWSGVSPRPSRCFASLCFA
eukprot:4363000-Alexandrium_andersonii.AAC.1